MSKWLCVCPIKLKKLHANHFEIYWNNIQNKLYKAFIKQCKLVIHQSHDHHDNSSNTLLVTSHKMACITPFKPGCDMSQKGKHARGQISFATMSIMSQWKWWIQKLWKGEVVWQLPEAEKLVEFAAVLNLMQNLW